MGGKQKGKIHVFIGLQASGKSTEAKRRLEEDGNLMRVNRDDLRAMLFARWKGRKESVVTAVEAEAIANIVGSGYSVIVDDTNLSPSTRAKWKTLADKLGVVLLEESFDTPVATCVQRDRGRKGRARVGRAVIENTALRYNLLPPLEEGRRVVIFDVDGTLADSSRRSRFLDLCRDCGGFREDHNTPTSHVFVGPPKKDHEAYYKDVLSDLVQWPVMHWLNSCYASTDLYPIVVSGRPTKVGADTEDWLDGYGAQYHHLFMRQSNDFRDDTIIKEEILEGLKTWLGPNWLDRIAFAVDDRPRVIRMWQKNGIKVYDVGPGTEF